MGMVSYIDVPISALWGSVFRNTHQVPTHMYHVIIM